MTMACETATGLVDLLISSYPLISIIDRSCAYGFVRELNQIRIAPETAFSAHSANECTARIPPGYPLVKVEGSI